MHLRDPQGVRRYPRRAVTVATLTIVCMLLGLSGCSRAEPQAKTQSEEASGAKPKTEAGEAGLPLCPEVDQPTPKGGDHKVILSWNASAPSANSKGKEIGYCLYRTKGHAVEKTGQMTIEKAPCKSCERVTEVPVKGTSYVDTHVENGAHYCYIAIAVETGNSNRSDFSNQADAVIPPREAPPFCTPQDNLKKAANRDHPGPR